MAAIELKDESDGGFCVVVPGMMAALGEEVHSYCLRPYVNRSGVLRLWPFASRAGRAANEWHRTAAVAAEIATRKWVRVTANRSLGAYEVFEAEPPPDPEWPDLDLQEMIRLAFSGSGQDHPKHGAPGREAVGWLAVTLDDFEELWCVGLRVPRTRWRTPRSGLPGRPRASDGACRPAVAGRVPKPATLSH